MSDSHDKDNLIKMLSILDTLGFNPILFPNSGNFLLVFKNNKFLSYAKSGASLGSIEGFKELTDEILSNSVRKQSIFTAISIPHSLVTSVKDYCLLGQFICTDIVFTELYETGIISKAEWSSGLGTLVVMDNYKSLLPDNTLYMIKEVLEVAALTGINKFTIKVDRSVGNSSGVNLLCDTRSVDLPASVIPVLYSPMDSMSFNELVAKTSEFVSAKYNIPSMQVNELLYGWNKMPAQDKIFNKANFLGSMDDWLQTVSDLVNKEDTRDMLTSLNRWFTVKEGKVSVEGTEIKDPRFQKMKNSILKKDSFDMDLFLDIICDGVESINGRGLPKSKQDVVLLLGEIFLRVSSTFISKRQANKAAVISTSIDD